MKKPAEPKYFLQIYLNKDKSNVSKKKPTYEIGVDDEMFLEILFRKLTENDAIKYIIFYQFIIKKSDFNHALLIRNPRAEDNKE